MHALIIDDQPLIAEMIGVELTQLGYTSFDVVDREEDAVAAAQGRCPDLITADDRLVSGTGIAAVERIAPISRYLSCSSSAMSPSCAGHFPMPTRLRSHSPSLPCTRRS